jgi:hypothetical protein
MKEGCRKVQKTMKEGRDAHAHHASQGKCHGSRFELSAGILMVLLFPDTQLRHSWSEGPAYQSAYLTVNMQDEKAG